MVRVLFLHPDLGIGGAERLVVDAAVALVERGYNVSFITNHHDPSHCFEETADGTLNVKVVGDWFPRKIFGRFYALCAYWRMLYAAMYVTFFMSRYEQIDVIFCDLVSIGVPILRFAKNRPKIIFYCHFPDQLLSHPGGLLKTIYRAPLNYIEEFTVGMADVALVNSKFTLRVFQKTFRRLHTLPEVLYPSLNTRYYDKMLKKQQEKSDIEKISTVMQSLNIHRNAFIFLDINRYERKKNHNLALKAFKKLEELLPPLEWKRCLLIVAGGYDSRVHENVEHFEELSKLKQKLDLEDNCLLMSSPSDKEKFQLLLSSHCLIYTPANEHFGIVPLEGMYMSKPVIAVNSGGPTETIVHQSTGYLCEPTVEAFADAMLQVFRDEVMRTRMGELGRKRVEQKFSYEAFSTKLDGIISACIKKVSPWTVDDKAK